MPNDNMNQARKAYSTTALNPIKSSDIESKDSKLIESREPRLIESKDSKYEAILYETQGRSHVQKCAPCQDRAYGYIDSNIAIITLCDGAGSAKHSHFGAEATTKCVADMLKANFDKYYNSPTPSDISKELIESINTNLKNVAVSTEKKLKIQAGQNIKKILKGIESKLKLINLQLSFDCESAIQNEIKNIESKIENYKKEITKKQDSIKDLESQNEENDKRDYLQRFKTKAQNSLETYEDKINVASFIYIKIIRKQRKKSMLKKFSDWIIESDKQEAQDFENNVIGEQRKIQKSMENETKSLNDFLIQVDSYLDKIKNATATDFNIILEALENLGDKILEKLESVYMTIKERVKKLKNILREYRDILEIESSKNHIHILETRNRFKDLIKKFMAIYKECIKKQKDLIESDIKKAQNNINELDSSIKIATNNIQNLESKIAENARLKKDLDSKLNEFNNAKNALATTCQTLSVKANFELKDIESINILAFKKAQDSLEKMCKTCENLCNEFNADTKNLQLNLNIDIESKLDSISKEIKNSTCEIKDLASTLLFVAIKGECCLIGHLGDGTIGALYTKELKVLSSGNNGEYANVTFFVTSQDAAKRLQIIKGNVKEKNINAFVLMSDGSSEGLLIKKENKFASALENRLKDSKESIKELIERVKEQKSFDDCSIAILRQKA